MPRSAARRRHRPGVPAGRGGDRRECDHRVRRAGRREAGGRPPAAKPGNDPDEEKSKREAEHGQPRGTARRSVGVPRHTGRPLPPYDVQGSTFPADGPEGPTTHRSTRAASRPAALPVLHCVFRC
ncbi:hypothetical protein PQR15_32780 [Streptomyces lydicus]|nr:hypothetical protein [Streptomyces lydicus]